ncbi:MAG: plastocyanin/azurin family copper-binding protein [Gemmatimonadota bacterium]|nr:plastocyanin/azurin family copper-binding protein [Gemmatimonadota bacterium]
MDNAFVDDQGRRNENARVTMSAGEMVGWIHNGANLHTVTFSQVPAGAEAEVTNSGNLSNGDTHEETLATPGTYEFFCQIHPQIMRMSVIIVN